MKGHRFTVPPTAEGRRLDAWLGEIGPGWSRSRVKKLIHDGCVLLDRRLCKPATRLPAGAVVEVREPDLQTAGAEPEDIALDVLYEDADVLVVDKPPDLVVHPAAGNPRGTLVNALLHHCDDLSGIGGAARPGIVHRLDKDTSGVMIVAKNDRAHLALSLAFQWRKVDKTYLAVCYGVPESPSGVIEAPIGRHPRDRKRMAVTESGRRARTLYDIREALDGAAVVACRLVTGRTHQIRVHMAHVGHALVGDPVYAGRQWRNLSADKAAACRDFSRQALHAWRLELTHPISGRRMVFEAPVPPDIQSLIAALRADEPPE